MCVPQIRHVQRATTCTRARAPPWCHSRLTRGAKSPGIRSGGLGPFASEYRMRSSIRQPDICRTYVFSNVRSASGGTLRNGFSHFRRSAHVANRQPHPPLLNYACVWDANSSAEPQTIQWMLMRGQHRFLSCCNLKFNQRSNVSPSLKLGESMFLDIMKQTVLFAAVLATGVVTSFIRKYLNRFVGFEATLREARHHRRRC